MVRSPDEVERVDEGWPLPHTYTVPIGGGAWGKRRETAVVLLRETGTVRAPRRLDHLLTEWWRPHHKTPRDWVEEPIQAAVEKCRWDIYKCQGVEELIPTLANRWY